MHTPEFREITDKLYDAPLWDDFFAMKKSQGSLRRRELEDLAQFIREKEYVKAADALLSGENFTTPRLMEINKSGTGRKRIVYAFGREETYLLKMISYLLRDYDSIFPEPLLSFRAGRGTRRAICDLRENVDLSSLYSYKLDIHDYFGSIDAEAVLAILDEALPGEVQLRRLLRAMLTDPKALQGDRLVTARKGVLAGVPTSGFLSNLYLMDLDRAMAATSHYYLRYADDILVFARTEAEIRELETQVRDALAAKGLTVNPSKEHHTRPGEPVEYLGFVLAPDRVDVAPMALHKIMAKLRRKARSIYRWRIRRDVPEDVAIRTFLRYVRRKFYGDPIRGEITWCRWYFPVLTTDESLRRLDEYIVSLARYIRTGRFGRQNYALRYETIRSMGFESLVHRYWKSWGKA